VVSLFGTGRFTRNVVVFVGRHSRHAVRSVRVQVKNVHQVGVPAITCSTFTVSRNGSKPNPRKVNVRCVVKHGLISEEQ